jgi:hypothetical protein
MAVLESPTIGMFLAVTSKWHWNLPAAGCSSTAGVIHCQNVKNTKKHSLPLLWD